MAFAAQNSGIERGNYYDYRDPNIQARRDGRRAFNQRARSITADWQRFKLALAACALENVTSTDVIAAAPHAFSGRLEWMPKQHTPTTVEAGEALCEGDWKYCAGQYFPTEYAKRRLPCSGIRIA